MTGSSKDEIAFPEAWAKLAQKELGEKPLSDLVWLTPEGIKVKPLYTAADLEGLEGLDTLPGVDPFTRGVRGTMYTNRPGRSGNMPASRRRKNPTPSIARISPPASRASASPSISPPIAAMTPIIRAWSAMSARPVWRSIPSRI